MRNPIFPKNRISLLIDKKSDFFPKSDFFWFDNLSIANNE